MRIGILLRERSVCGGKVFFADYLDSSQARQRGIIAVPLRSLEDLNTQSVDCVQFMGVHRMTLQDAQGLSQRKIPYVVYSNGVGIFNTQLIRFVRASGKLVANSIGDRLRNIPLASKICAGSAKVFVNSEQQASIIEHGLGISKEKIAVVHPIIDERFLHADASSFKQKFGIDRFILAI